MSSFQRAREALGQRLSELRQDAKLSGRQLAQECGWAPSKISKIEGGKQTPSAEDIEQWARACGTPEAAADLVVALRSIEGQYVQFARSYQMGTAGVQQMVGRRESGASIIRSFAVTTVPGLLQTAEYARAILVYWAKYSSITNDAEAGVAARIARQQILNSPKKRFHFVLTESVLRFRFGPDEVIAAQLKRLYGAAAMSNVRFGIIPDSRLYAGATPIHGFDIYDERQVNVETVSAELQLEETAEVRTYLGFFADYAKLAVYGDETHELISRALSALTNS